MIPGLPFLLSRTTTCHSGYSRSADVFTHPCVCLPPLPPARETRNGRSGAAPRTTSSWASSRTSTTRTHLSRSSSCPSSRSPFRAWGLRGSLRSRWAGT